MLAYRQWPLLLLFAVTAPAGRSPSGVAQSSAINAALDSCNRATYRATDPRRPTPLTAARRTFGSFSIAVPRGVRVTGADTVRGYVAFDWPGCGERCRFSVTVRPDSGRSAEKRVADLVEEQRKIDSTNKASKEAMQFDVIDGPPEKVQTTAGQAWLIDNDCGDCGAYSLLIGRPGEVATINYSADDMKPALPLHFCEMKAVAFTFNWSSPAKR